MVQIVVNERLGKLIRELEIRVPLQRDMLLILLCNTKPASVAPSIVTSSNVSCSAELEWLLSVVLPSLLLLRQLRYVAKLWQNSGRTSPLGEEVEAVEEVEEVEEAMKVQVAILCTGGRTGDGGRGAGGG